MGDVPSNNPVRSADYDDVLRDGKSQAPAGSGMSDGVAFHSQSGGFPQQYRPDSARQHAGMAAYTHQVQNAPGGAFNLGSMANALADYGQPQQAHRAQPGNPAPLRGPQYSSNPSFGGHFGPGQFPGPSIDTSLDLNAMQQTQRAGSIGLPPSPYSPYGQQVPQYYYTNAQFGAQAQQPFFTGSAQTMPQYDRRVNQNTPQGLQAGYMGIYQAQVAGRPVPGPGGYADPYASSEGAQRPPSSEGMSSVPRGPPRKPKQSGHALWVGNLPPGTTVLDLKDHFSREATKDIESLFLISKSNCAFVNYRSEASCAAAMQRFHDSRFHGVRLVCRLRRSSAPPPGVPSAPSAMSPTTPTTATIPSSAPFPPTKTGPEVSRAQPDSDVDDAVPAEPTSGEKVRDKFFIVKSLTLQDLELSVRNGIWATQSHNEEALNKAYETAENVYLVFSANKSGEYFGYARMTSSISEDAKQVLGAIPRHEPVIEAADVPRTIATPATEFAPKGHIIDDSARGTIFWEADHSDDELEEDVKTAVDGEDEGAVGPQSWGKPFKIEWVSTNRLPFYRTRGLRNPWNANREVKIARDGTELEPNVGNRLIQMFHRMGQPPGTQMPQMAMPGMQAQIGGPNMRPYV